MTTKRCVLAGGSGFLGTALADELVLKGYEVIVLTRVKPGKEVTEVAGLTYALWDVAKQTIDTAAIAKSDYIIHLAGAGVAEKRWTAKRKKEIIESRTQSSALLVKALQQNSNKVKAVISASAIGWYGADPATPNTKPFAENDPADHAFLGETCQQWEASIEPVTQLGKRLVKLRTGIVLSTEGGAFKEFIKPLKFGIAAILGNGRQMISWIHIDDQCRMYLQAIEDKTMQGVYNAVSPKPVSNKELTVQLAKNNRGKFYIPVYIPSFVLKTVLGELSIEVLKSATVSAQKIREAGFVFQYPDIIAALNALKK